MRRAEVPCLETQDLCQSLKSGDELPHFEQTYWGPPQPQPLDISSNSIATSLVSAWRKEMLQPQIAPRPLFTTPPPTRW